jgi:hypothetical protein
MVIKKYAYWISTVILCLIFLYSAQMYFFKTEMIQGFFESFSYPTYLVIPLAIAKILGVIMILWRKSNWLTEWAYAGFFFDLILASLAHYYAGHDLGLSILGFFFLFPSYFLGKAIRN